MGYGEDVLDGVVQRSWRPGLVGEHALMHTEAAMN
jgi:hypothetical protein